MDGFNEEGRNCYSNGHCPDRHKAAYGYVPRNEVKPYWAMAELYTFADEMFASNEGPSFPAHQYLISGTSTITNRSIYKAAENPTDPRGKRRQGGCNSLHEAVVETIDPAGKQSKPVYPCFNRDSLMQLMNAHGVSWRYYQEFGGSGEWHAVDAIEPIWKSASYANVMWPSERVLRDVAAGELADVTFVTPSAIDSDHSGRNNGTGPSWVSSIVNTIGESPYWDHTAIIVTWDDWGGWYDHVVPHRFNSYEVSFRVPMIVISPYAKRGHVSHVKYEFGSILKYVEQTFKLGSLHTTDVRSNDLSDCFDFAGRPSAFTPIPAAYSAQYFEQLPVDYDSPDDDN
jgi:phospholipase C